LCDNGDTVSNDDIIIGRITDTSHSETLPTPIFQITSSVTSDGLGNSHISAVSTKFCDEIQIFGLDGSTVNGQFDSTGLYVRDDFSAGTRGKGDSVAFAVTAVDSVGTPVIQIGDNINCADYATLRYYSGEGSIPGELDLDSSFRVGEDIFLEAASGQITCDGLLVNGDIRYGSSQYLLQQLNISSGTTLLLNTITYLEHIFISVYNATGGTLAVTMSDDQYAYPVQYNNAFVPYDDTKNYGNGGTVNIPNGHSHVFMRIGTITENSAVVPIWADLSYTSPPPPM